MPYRWQAGAVLLSALAPWIGNALYIARVAPLYPLDLTPFAFVVSAGLLAWSIFRYRLLDIVPIAHGAVVDGIPDAMIVLDARARVVELNPSALELVKMSKVVAA